MNSQERPEEPAPADAWDRLVLVANTHRVAPGLLSWPAWEELRRGPAYCSSPEHPQLPFLRAAGVEVEVLSAEPAAPGLRVSYLAGGGGVDPGQIALAHRFRERARGGQAVWLASAGGDPDFTRALGDLVGREGGVEMEVVYGSYDLPGARLLDLVATMDRLRSPGGCPWDAEQTHQSLAPYLVEETYEALEAIETDDLGALREELGDVLLQVVFHARIAEEHDEDSRWSIDDVARGIVEKLVRRHPHVFGDVTVSGADEVVANWETLKSEEKARGSAMDDVPLGQPALSLAAKLQRRAARAGLPAPVLPDIDTALADARAAAAEERPEVVGSLLFATVALARALDVDPESALRGAARRFRDQSRALEQTAEPDEADMVGQPSDGTPRR